MPDSADQAATGDVAVESAVSLAQRLADEVLFPGALEVDAADEIPVDRLDALAEAGLYGLLAPRELGGLGADGPTMVGTIEALSSGCLTTALVWLQHLAPLAHVMFGPPRLRETYLPNLAAGRVRGGIAFAGLLSGPPLLTAKPRDGGWSIAGRAPWVSGWGRIDVLHVAARGPDETVVHLLLDARSQPGLSCERLRLAAVDASCTVHLAFDEVAVPEERVMSVQPYDPAASLGASLRANGSLSLGVAARCCRLIGSGPLDEQLVARRAALDAASPAEMASERALASAFAVQTAAGLVAHVGSRAILTSEHAQRLAREAMFLLVFGSRPMIRDALSAALAVPRSS